MKERTIGGFTMPREYRHIKQYEKEIVELREAGFTYREIGEQLGIEQIKIKQFFERQRKNEKKLAAGVVIKPKGRPRKDGKELPPSVQQLSKLTQLKYELAYQERRIRQLEMENELMRDFLSLTGRK